MRNRFWLLLLIFVTQCATNKLPKEDIIAMKARFVLEYGKNPDLWPVMVGLKEQVYSIFPVPSKDAVGTNEIDHAITLLRFKDDNIQYEQLIKDHPGASSGGLYSHCPVFDKEWIAYGQSRGFSFFNIKTKQFVDHIPYPQLGLRITEAKAIPNMPFTFLIQIMRANARLTDRVLQIVQFDLKGNFKILAELEQIGRHAGERGEPLIICDNKIFGWHKNVFEVFDLKLKASQHPLVTLLNNLKSRDIVLNSPNELIIHQEIPLAILKEVMPDYSAKVWLLRWENPEPEEQIIELVEQKISLFSDIKKLLVWNFQISPDGKWLLFEDGSADLNKPSYVVMPIDKDEEYFIGKPKMLGKVLGENASPVSSAWISEPLSYVVSDGMVLYKWELENLRREF